MEISQPHTVTQKRPAAARNAATNEMQLDYAAPAMTNASFACMFQTRAGRFVQLDTGLGYSLDGILYCLSPDVQINDRFEVSAAQVGFDAAYLVVGTAPKTGIDGSFSHVQVSLTKDARV